MSKLCTVLEIIFIFVGMHSFYIGTYIYYYCDLLFSENELEIEYDYIIVGSGTAGSVIAQRIASDTNFTYVVIEAGSHGGSILEVPSLGPLLHESVYDWHYKTVPQDNACLAMNDKKCRFPLGKITGGSAKINNMLHIRGNLLQYVDWFHGKYTTNFFQKQFEYIEENIVPVQDTRFESELSNTILNAADELGFEHIDLNKHFGSGFMKSKVNQKNGKRWVAYDTFETVQRYKLVTNMEVLRVLLNYKGMARAIEMLNSHNTTLYIRAKKGIILCAGALNTPKILQHSGIGPANLLRQYNITLVKDLPVGKNLQDHVTTGLDLILLNKTLNVTPYSYHVLMYMLYGIGPLTSPGCESVGFLSTNGSKSPNIQLMTLPLGLTTDRGIYLRKSLNINNSVWDDYFHNLLDIQTASILPVLLQPKSVGDVKIGSKDPRDAPLINPNYFSVRDDMETLIDSMQIIMNFTETHAMQKLGARVNNASFPGCEHLEIFSRFYWECYIRHLTLTSYHPVGTCKLGLKNARDSVVDTSFRVIGVDNLFVVDGSVLPSIPQGNVNAAIAMMANVFFDTVISEKMFYYNNHCLRLDYLNEVIYQVCLITN